MRARIAAGDPNACGPRTPDVVEKEESMSPIRTGLLVLSAALVLAAPAAAAAGAPVEVVKTSSLGKVVANAKGHTLYLFRADHGTTSACYGQCAKYWPPLLTSGKPKAMAGVHASLLGTARRKDGKLQVTYKGHPLYLYAGDAKRGQTAGEGSSNFGAKWYALAPSGATIDRD
jgi:predicted lipoprotein with Yx(FWY)xxD motif